jgi:hypothetical protein
MRNMTAGLSENGKRAMEHLKQTVQSFAGASELIEKCAVELAMKDDAEAEAELQRASRELVEQIARGEPTLSKTVVNGLVIGFCELVAARCNDIKSHGGHA